MPTNTTPDDLQEGLHSYEEWRRLGFQVLAGSRHVARRNLNTGAVTLGYHTAVQLPGPTMPLFDRTQVVPMNMLAQRSTAPPSSNSTTQFDQFRRTLDEIRRMELARNSVISESLAAENEILQARMNLSRHEEALRQFTLKTPRRLVPEDVRYPAPGLAALTQREREIKSQQGEK